MALTLGTNCGFVSSAPVDDPSATAVQIDTRSIVIKHAVPADASVVTKIGWWCRSTSEEANFEVALYEDSSGAPGSIAGSGTYIDNSNAKGTTSGWKTVDVSWDVSGYAGGNLWIAIQCDDTASVTQTDWTSDNGSGLDTKTESSLADPYGGGALYDSDAKAAIYALYTTSGASYTDSGSLTQAGAASRLLSLNRTNSGVL